MTSPYLLPKGNVQISFSGGRTSAFMLHQILEANGGLPETARVCFENTGREMPETLDFIHECESRWNVDIIWLEYALDNNKPYASVINYQTAAQNGEPFDALITKYNALPNVAQRFCTGELKAKTGNRYLKKLGWKKWYHAIGIRADEAHRAKPNRLKSISNFYPLIDAGVTKNHVHQFWRESPFDLQLPSLNGKTAKGNCDLCFLKSEAILASMAREYPDRAKWWIDKEKQTGRSFHKVRKLNSFVDFVERQKDWVFDDESYFCQADDGECAG